MAAETTPLLPCPFPACQSDDVAMVSGPSYSVYCLNCGATGPSELTETEAAALWNRRDTTALDELRAAVVRYLTAIDAYNAETAAAEETGEPFDVVDEAGMMHAINEAGDAMRALVGLEG